MRRSCECSLTQLYLLLHSLTWYTWYTWFMHTSVVACRKIDMQRYFSGSMLTDTSAFNGLWLLSRRETLWGPGESRLQSQNCIARGLRCRHMRFFLPSARLISGMYIAQPRCSVTSSAGFPPSLGARYQGRDIHYVYTSPQWGQYRLAILPVWTWYTERRMPHLEGVLLSICHKTSSRLF